MCSRALGPLFGSTRHDAGAELTPASDRGRYDTARSDIAAPRSLPALELCGTNASNPVKQGGSSTSANVETPASLTPLDEMAHNDDITKAVDRLR
jgi:hypothetical protein